MKKLGAHAVLVAALSAGLFVSVPGFAQAPQKPADAAAAGPSSDKGTEAKRAEARQRFQRGLQLFEEGNFEAARVELERAYQLAPSYKILYNVGLCYEQLGDYVQAQTTLQSYLETGGIDISEERRAEVNKELNQIRPRIGKLTLHTNVPGVEALVDDTCSTDASTSALSCTPLTGTSRVLLMNPGRRRVTFRKDGYVQQTQMITIAGSDEAELIVTMRLAPSGAEKKSNPYVLPTVVSGGVTVAGLATTIVLGILTKNASSDQDDRLSRLGVTHADLVDGRSKTRELASFTTGFGIGTGVALVVTAYFAYRAKTWKHATADTVGGITRAGFTF